MLRVGFFMFGVAGSGRYIGWQVQALTSYGYQFIVSTLALLRKCMLSTLRGDISTARAVCWEQSAIQLCLFECE